MEVREAIYGRRSVRSYQNKAVGKEIIREILEGACMAPSAINLQPWYFLAVSNENERKKFLGYMNETYSKFKPILESRFAANPAVVEETGRFLTTLGGAPVVVLAFLLKDEPAPSQGGGLGAIMSVAAAIENMLLMAYDKGLSACWITAPTEFGPAERIRADFAPDKGKLLGAVVLGYSEQKPAAPRRREGRFNII
jgi:nitroreductase